ncbi:hypothetical protein VCB98_00655 [Gammaproteobacteria bacterium AB-CW1]|uniref:Lipoprotein n=2 Tax=Natronospira TaxID=2024969 RepID=A0AAP6MLR1_9GAMM|nr:hypothetical protein [Gammaproteobacteria bacterium AB-CW1]
MTTRVILILVASLFFLSACFSSSSSDDESLTERDRAEAAASAAVLSGSIDPPDDDDDDEGVGNMGPLGNSKARIQQAFEICDTGSVESGTDTRDSLYTQSGEIGVEWNYYQDCVQGAETEFAMTTDGYQAYGDAEDWTVSYMRWTGSPDQPLDADGAFVTGFPGGEWRIRGSMHSCDECQSEGFPIFDDQGFLRWEVEGEGERVVFQYGEPNNFFHTRAEDMETHVSQSIDGYVGILWEGTPCDLEVEYTTLENMIISDFGTRDEVIQSGRLNLDIRGGGSYEVEFQDGQVFLDGQLVEPDENNPCAGAFELTF